MWPCRRQHHSPNLLLHFFCDTENQGEVSSHHYSYIWVWSSPKLVFYMYKGDLSGSFLELLFKEEYFMHAFQQNSFFSNEAWQWRLQIFFLNVSISYFLMTLPPKLALVVKLTMMAETLTKLMAVNGIIFFYDRNNLYFQNAGGSSACSYLVIVLWNSIPGRCCQGHAMQNTRQK